MFKISLSRIISAWFSIRAYSSAHRRACKNIEPIEQNAGSTACALCEKTALRNFTHWKIVNNVFPYDQIAKVHHMIVPRRHTTEQGLTAEELGELADIKHGHMNEVYDWIIEATHRNKSIPDHFHLHLIIGKPAERAI